MSEPGPGPAPGDPAAGGDPNEIKLTRETAKQPHDAKSGRWVRIILPPARIEWTMVDEAENPCSFFAYELTFRGSGAGRPPIRGFLDERGKIVLDPAPRGEFDVALFDELGARVEAFKIAKPGRPLQELAPPEGTKPPDQAWR